MPPCEFHWVEKGRLAGCGQPGLFCESDDDYAWLQSVGIRHLVCLTETEIARPHEKHAIQAHHFPIVDMSVPCPDKLLSLFEDITQWLLRDEPVVVHCKAGLGRTGLVLASFLVFKGVPAQRAIGNIRKLCSKYVQTSGQEHFINHFMDQRSVRLPD